ncbi:MAG: phosphohydrolase [Bacteroidetes bacterium]|nr:MAG: phosphohydrolase [Bacteroidota bacterium]
MHAPEQIHIDATASFVQKTLKDAEKGHDWDHIERVWRTARYLHRKEGRGDRLVVELAALLHDISDAKFNGGDLEAGARITEDYLHERGLKEHQIRHISLIVKHVSFKGGFPQTAINSIEFQIVQDADRLDAIGAIGIARAFHYGGHKNRRIHDPNYLPTSYADSASYYLSEAPTIAHFHEKLLKLKDLMNTTNGRALAEERHRYMLGFLEQFGREYDPA